MESTASVQDLLKSGALAGDWTLDPDRSTVSLKSKSIWGLVAVNGVFGAVSGKGTVSPDGGVSGVITVGAASIDTKNTKRDNHLRSADFFESDEHPDITFTVASIKPSGQGVTVTGTLTVHGTDRPLSLDGAAAVQGDGEVSLDAQVQIDRTDFGLTWNQLGMMSKISTVTFHAVFTK